MVVIFPPVCNEAVSKAAGLNHVNRFSAHQVDILIVDIDQTGQIPWLSMVVSKLFIRGEGTSWAAKLYSEAFCRTIVAINLEKAVLAHLARDPPMSVLMYLQTIQHASSVVGDNLVPHLAAVEESQVSRESLEFHLDSADSTFVPKVVQCLQSDLLKVCEVGQKVHSDAV